MKSTSADAAFDGGSNRVVSNDLSVEVQLDDALNRRARKARARRIAPALFPEPAVPVQTTSFGFSRSTWANPCDIRIA